MTPVSAAPIVRGKRGPKTPEGRARSAINALKHGLRSRDFALLPEEDPAEWAEHLADLRRDLGPVDPTEEKLVTAIAVSMWKEIRADHAEAGVLTRMTDESARGRDLGDKRNALSLGTSIRYGTAAGMATMRAHRAFLAHRRAKQKGLLLPVPMAEPAICTNELPARTAPHPTEAHPAAPRPTKLPKCTNEFPATSWQPPADPLAALRARIARLLDGSSPPDPATHDLAAAIRAVRLPGAAPYRGPIDLDALDRILTQLRLDTATLARVTASTLPEPAAMAA